MNDQPVGHEAAQVACPARELDQLLATPVPRGQRDQRCDGEPPRLAAGLRVKAGGEPGIEL